MTFQETVRKEQASGIIGEIIFDGPCRARPLTLNSGGTTPNRIGKAFTYNPAVNDEVGAGSIGGGAFAGILIHPKHYALQGTDAGSLEPNLNLPDNTIGELLSMGTIVVNLTAIDTGKIGEGIYYEDATGLLGSGTAVAGQTQLVNAKIDRENVFGPGLAIITLTEPEGVVPAPAP